MSELGEPIIYEWKLDVRSNDLDRYDHVAAPVYLDYIFTSRWHFIKENFGLSNDDFVKKGLGFFTARSEMNYKRPITGATSIVCRSHVEEIRRDGKEVVVTFEIVSASKSTVHCEGKLFFAVVDLHHPERPTPCTLPEWTYEYFFKKIN